jgi:hypothetical protein
MIAVKSPPSSRSIFGFQSGFPIIVCLIHHKYSSSVSPFQAKTGIPALAIAAAAWSCVENILQEDHLTSAPKATSVYISTAVWIVMCKHPIILAPFKGLDSEYSSRNAIKPGISLSAIEISFLPNSADDMSFTLKSSMRKLI